MPEIARVGDMSSRVAQRGCRTTSEAFCSYDKSFDTFQKSVSSVNIR